MTGWQPISTAPSKGWFLIYAKDESGWDCIIPARRVRGEATMMKLRNGFPLEDDRFTHWMPYPARPGAPLLITHTHAGWVGLCDKLDTLVAKNRDLSRENEELRATGAPIAPVEHWLTRANRAPVSAIDMWVVRD